jgi:predicted dienelactone hydrolase
MAPALGPAFLPDSLERIDIPVAIVAGAADAIVPVGTSARSYAAHIPRAELTIFPGDVGHYVFLADCTEAGRATLPALCLDAPGVDRDTIHVKTADLAVLRAPSAIVPQPSRPYRADDENPTPAVGGKRSFDDLVGAGED